MLRRFMATVMTCVLLVSMLAFPAAATNTGSVNMTGIQSFVTRMYNVCLDRQPDQSGLEAWSNQLATKQATGCSVAYGFVFSNEFQSKNCSNEDYVRYMYSAFFGRQPDQAGFDAWVNALNSGTTRENVFCGFANSVEFGNLCSSYGVVRGYHMEGEDAGRIAKVNLFVERLYNEVLDRSCDNSGMQGWTTQLVTRANSGCEAAYGFVFSDEFINLHLCNAHYLDVLYRAFMGREADSNGKAAWKAQLDNGVTREEIFNGFAGSQEFIRICQSYGIDSGSITLPENGTHATGTCPICGTAAPSVPSGNGESNGSTSGSTGSGNANTPSTPSTPTATPTPTPAPKHQIGEIVQMGRDSVGPMKWKIIDYKDGAYLVRLVRGAYQLVISVGSGNQWENGSLRRSCQSIYWNYLTMEERQRVILTTNTPNSYWRSNTINDYTTVDGVFLLSSAEIQDLYPTEQDRLANGIKKVWVRDSIGNNYLELIHEEGDQWCTVVNGGGQGQATFSPVMWVDLDSEEPNHEIQYKYNVGDVVEFGKSNIVKWTVLDREGEVVTLIANQGVYASAFSADGSTNVYEKSTVYKWLHEDYLMENFYEGTRNSIISIDIPSIELLSKYYPSQADWKIMPSTYAHYTCNAWVNSDGYTWYWVSDQCSTPGKAYYVTSVGGYKTYDVKDATACVRPVITIKLP